MYAKSLGLRMSRRELVECYMIFGGVPYYWGYLDKRYSLDFGEKCYWYMQEGFIPGKNFFITSDDINGGTDTQAIWEVAKAVERLFFAK